MFWKKKKTKQVEVESKSSDYAGFLFIQAIEVSNRYYQGLLINNSTHPLIKGKKEHWYFYFAIAAAMTGLFELKEDYEENYIKVMERIDNWDSQGVVAAEDFNAFISNYLNKMNSDLGSIHLPIAQWLYYNVKESTDFLEDEIEPFAIAGKLIADNFYGWFSKNQLK